VSSTTWFVATLQIRVAFGPSLKDYAIRATCGHAYASWAFAQQVRQLDTAVIADRMLNLGIRHIPVTRDGTVLGMVSMRDLLAFEMWVA